jgi:hypothetical protein
VLRASLSHHPPLSPKSEVDHRLIWKLLSWEERDSTALALRCVPGRTIPAASCSKPPRLFLSRPGRDPSLARRVILFPLPTVGPSTIPALVRLYKSCMVRYTDLLKQQLSSKWRFRTGCWKQCSNAHDEREPANSAGPVWSCTYAARWWYGNTGCHQNVMLVVDACTTTSGTTNQDGTVVAARPYRSGMEMLMYLRPPSPNVFPWKLCR